MELAGGLPAEDRKQLVLRAPRGPVLFCLGRVVRRAASTFSCVHDASTRQNFDANGRYSLGFLMSHVFENRAPFFTKSRFETTKARLYLLCISLVNSTVEDTRHHSRAPSLFLPPDDVGQIWPTAATTVHLRPFSAAFLQPQVCDRESPTQGALERPA